MNDRELGRLKWAKSDGGGLSAQLKGLELHPVRPGALKAFPASRKPGTSLSGGSPTSPSPGIDEESLGILCQRPVRGESVVGQPPLPRLLSDAGSPAGLGGGHGNTGVPSPGAEVRP